MPINGSNAVSPEVSPYVMGVYVAEHVRWNDGVELDDAVQRQVHEEGIATAVSRFWLQPIQKIVIRYVS